MFSPVKAVTTGVIVFAIGGAFLIAQPFEQQGSVPGATGDAGVFSPAGSLAQPRSGHTATLLPDGRVLFVGGANPWAESLIATAEIWDPATETFGPTGAPAEARAGHTATELNDGTILLTGGFTGKGSVVITDSGELYNPASRELRTE